MKVVNYRVARPFKVRHQGPSVQGLMSRAGRSLAHASLLLADEVTRWADASCC
jgi:hypothetical protein